MSQGRRNGCLIAVLILAAFACCIVAAAAVSLGFVTDWTYDVNWERPGEFLRNIDWGQAWQGGHLRETDEETFEDIGDEPRLVVDSFAGAITVLAGERDTIEVVATKRANTQDRLDDIEVDWSQNDLGVEISTRRGRLQGGQASVALDITAPPGTHIELRLGVGDVRIEDIHGEMTVSTGTGDVDIRGALSSIDVSTGTGDILVEDIDGELKARTGTGRIDVQGADGPAELRSGTGDIDYEGRPEDASSFDAGLGEITLRLPTDADVEVDLTSGLGDVSVRGFEDVEESKHAATGTIGDGSRGSVRAHTGLGDIQLVER